MSDTPTIWLASRSPRRKLLPNEGGYEIRAKASDLEDGDLIRGRVNPESWVMALAYFKARRVECLLGGQSKSGDVILGADTLCVHGDAILGQPKDESDARRMIHRMMDATHRTMTGVCLLEVPTHRRLLVCDVSEVEVGHLGDEEIETYLASGQWQGKAGAYNLIERQEAGWPITCRGDPATVMGLPMRKLPGWLDRFGFAC